MKHYDAIVAAAEKIGWPTCYKDDLFLHDKNACEQHSENRPFAWSVRETGTHLIYGDSEFDRSWGRAAANSDGDRARYFVWNGTSLKSVSQEQWIKFIYDQPLKSFTIEFDVEDTHYWHGNRRRSEWIKVSAYDYETAKQVAQFEANRQFVDAKLVDKETVCVS